MFLFKVKFENELPQDSALCVSEGWNKIRKIWALKLYLLPTETHQSYYTSK